MHKIGDEHIHFAQIGSTNDYAMELISKTTPIHGTAISADFQSAGRGQYGRTWLSSPDQNVAVTIILKPSHLSIDEQFYLNKAIAIGVATALSSITSIPVCIKWPNDIICNDKKVSGILIQNILSGQQYKYAVVGIGVNVNQSKFDANIPNPTSLQLEAHRTFETDAVLKILFANLNEIWTWIEQRDFTTIQDRYMDLLYRQGENVVLENDLQQVLGVFKLEKVDRHGRIIVTDSNLKQYSFALGEARIKLSRNKEF